MFRLKKEFRLLGASSFAPVLGMALVPKFTQKQAGEKNVTPADGKAALVQDSSASGFSMVLADLQSAPVAGLATG